MASIPKQQLDISEFTSLFANIQEIISSELLNPSGNLSALDTILLPCIAQLKQLQRLASISNTYQNELTAAVRSELAEDALKRENLRYEKQRLEMEIKRCQDFNGAEVDLKSSEDRFWQSKQDAAAQSGEKAVTVLENYEDNHELMMERLQFELSDMRGVSEETAASHLLVQKLQKDIKDISMKATAADHGLLDLQKVTVLPRLLALAAANPTLHFSLDPQTVLTIQKQLKDVLPPSA